MLTTLVTPCVFLQCHYDFDIGGLEVLTIIEWVARIKFSKDIHGLFDPFVFPFFNHHQVKISVSPILWFMSTYLNSRQSNQPQLYFSAY